MGKFLQSVGQTLLATVFILLFLELICRALGLPTGANSYIEAIALREKLSTRKPAGEFRIFAYGESTMHGSHYWPASNPSHWMEAYLKDFLPGKNIRVVNFSRMGQGSDFVTRSVKNTLVYKPDLIIFYAGHNGFLPGNRVDQVLKKDASFSKQFKFWIRNSVLISSAIRLGIAGKLKRGKNIEEDVVGAVDIESFPSGIGGAENEVTRDSDYYKQNIAHHRKNYEKILQMAEAQHIPVITFRPAANLKDYPPSCSQHRNKLSEEQKAAWEKAYETGRARQASGDTAGALLAYEEAYAIGPTHANLLYQMGQLYMKSGDLKKAYQFFVEAKDEDCIIVRAPTVVQDYFEGFGKNGKAVVIDAEKLLVSEAPGGILGDPIVEDNVHFSVKGHAILGRALAQEIANRDWIAPKSEWKFERERSFEIMEKELGVTPELIFEAFLKCSSYFGSKYDSRILYAKKALAIHPDSPKALRHLAWSYWLKGDKTHSLEIYQKISEIAPDQLKAIFEERPEIGEAFQAKSSALPAAA